MATSLLKNGILKTICNVNAVRTTFARSICGPAFDSGPSFKYDDLDITLSENLKSKPHIDDLLFGRHCSDHMLTVDWTKTGGWGKPRITPLKNLEIHPAAKVLHYAVEFLGIPLVKPSHVETTYIPYAVSKLFEGMKAFRTVDDDIKMFRPVENMYRMNTTAERACLPTFDKIELLKCMKKLIQIEESWVPKAANIANALYLRPTIIGTEPCLGVAVSGSATLFVITGPVGPFYKTGIKPVSLMADPDYTRAWHGGCGQYKMGSNYGPTIAIQMEAERRGCQQVLWLCGDDHEITEVGSMNFFMHWINKDGAEELITAPNEGLILPGITRKSIIQIANDWNDFRVSERKYTMEDVIIGLYENRVLEMFGAGTACMVAPVNRILYRGEWLEIPLAKDENSVSHRMMEELTAIQYGKKPHHWVESVYDIENTGCSNIDCYMTSDDSDSELERRI